MTVINAITFFLSIDSTNIYILAFILGVTPNSRRFDASIAGARLDSQSHSRIFAGCYGPTILAVWSAQMSDLTQSYRFSPNKLIQPIMIML